MAQHGGTVPWAQHCRHGIVGTALSARHCRHGIVGTVLSARYCQHGIVSTVLSAGIEQDNQPFRIESIQNGWLLFS